ncbi:respiratory nitrate reductase subunit gamma [Streptomyces sp. NPDC008137]|uniref:respiratory nitrate reductase subunit gamma n=1 Tax=Streptomyces sp. NPDC008137 TaxID=3364813 RepID=UPI0036F0AD9F
MPWRPAPAHGSVGTIAGVATLGGLSFLIYRRRTVGLVFSATTRNDKAMYVSLTVTIVLGLAATVVEERGCPPMDMPTGPAAEPGRAGARLRGGVFTSGRGRSATGRPRPSS